MTRQYATICELRCSANKTKFRIKRTAPKHIQTTKYRKACLQNHSSITMSVTVPFVQVCLLRPYSAVLLHCWEQCWCIAGRNKKNARRSCFFFL